MQRHQKQVKMGFAPQIPKYAPAHVVLMAAALLEHIASLMVTIVVLPVCILPK
jgi:hypothetical protein